MKNRPELKALITDDFKLEYDIPRLLEVQLQLIGAGKHVRVDVVQWKKKRTLKQNAYLWSTVYPTIIKYIKDNTGQDFTVKNLHNKYKKQYLGYEVCKIPGMEELIKLRSSTELDTEEFWGQLIEHICREWGELGLFIPMPRKIQRG